MLKSRKFWITAAAAVAFAAPVYAEKLGLGRAALAEEIDAWDVAVLPDGTGLPEGAGDVITGEQVFGAACASCHGEFAEGLDSWPVLAGGDGSLQDPRPVKTIGSYWPYLSTVFDYVHRSMPFGGAQTLTNDETYAITAFLLYSNGLVDEDFVLTQDNFTEITMPNVDGFVVDDRAETEYPLFRVEPCMADCREATAPQVTKRAIELKVTPADENGKPLGTLPNLTLAAAAEVTAPATAEETSPAEAAADPQLAAAGEKVFKKCAACHKLGDGAKNTTGPILNGIVGGAAGAVEGFKYSKPLLAMAEAGLVWDEAALHGFLENPKAYVKGTKMSFAGLKKEEDRAALIAYLSGFSK